MINRLPPRALTLLPTRLITLSRSFSSTLVVTSRSTSHRSLTPSKHLYPGWIPTIGVELHVQLKNNLKLFSKALAQYDAPPNSHVALLDASFPGSLPVLQPQAVRLALLACLAFGSKVNEKSTFDRKHYWYPDQPSGYQITQKYAALAKGGMIRVRKKGGSGWFEVRLEQVQLEQDTAKSFHDPDSSGTLVDLNRSGAALIEIVTLPDLSSAEEAASFVRTIQAILRHVGTSNANMDKGELRVDVNVSVRPEDSSTPGTRCEVKNLNGIRFISSAIDSEIQRQISLLREGREVVQETRGYDALSGETFSLRSKEDAPDYRYFPDPELGSILITPEQLEELRDGMPELPEVAFERLQREYGISERDAGILVALGEGIEESSRSGESEQEGEGEGSASIGVSYFERVAKGREARICANWVIHELLGGLTKVEKTLLNNPIEPEELGQLIDTVTQGRLTGTNAKSFLRSFLSSSSTSSFSSSLSSLLDSTPPPPSSSSFSALLQEVIDSHPEEVGKIKGGNKKVVMRLVGEVMKRSKGKADAKWVREELEKRLMSE
ncbi:hypothetical protein JCM5353_007541 [Sporobolomyces roseus]